MNTPFFIFVAYLQARLLSYRKQCKILRAFKVVLRDVVSTSNQVIPMKFGKAAGFLVKCLLICALSGGLAVVFNSARPNPYTFAELSHPQPPEILEIATADLVQDYSAEKFSFVDARSAMEFEMGHVPGAVNIPIDKEGAELADLAAKVDSDRKVIVYCDGLACGKSMIVAKKLRGLGFKDISIYTDGIDGWIGAGMDLEAN